MKTKKVFFTEWAYVLGLITLACGAALMERADFGLSMVVAPAYLLHLKISQFFPAYTFGMSEYVFQAVLLLALCIVMRRLKKGYLFSFVTAVLYGLLLDLLMAALALLPFGGTVWRAVFYVSGLVFCSIGVSLMFHTYFPPEVYELFVKELTERYGWKVEIVKTVYDCCSCLLGIALSFAFFGFGHFEGVKLGTVLCALVNGWLIGRISHRLDSRFEFRDGLPWRDFFTK